MTSFKKTTKRNGATATGKIREFDRVLTGGLMMVAAAAAALPWYVFLNPEKFGISGKGWEALKHVPQRGGGGVEAVIPHVEEDKVADGKMTQTGVDIDAVVTATVPTSGQAQADADDAIAQPFPGGDNFKLLHVSNGRVLIEDKSGMFLVQVGSILPDESRLLSLSNVNGKWQIITSAGQVYSE